MQRTILFGAAILAISASATAPKADAALRHRYSFTSDANDSISGAHGTVIDAGSATNAVFTGGALNLTANNGDLSQTIGEDAYVNLPNGIISALGSVGTFETWVTVETNRTWAEIFSFGASRQDNGGEDLSSGFGKYLTLIPASGPSTVFLTAIQFPDGSPDYAPFGITEISTPGGAVLSPGVRHHMVGVVDNTDTMGGVNPNGTMRLYIDGGLAGSLPLYNANTLGTLPDVNNWLGRSQWNDPLFDGIYDEFRIYDTAMSTQQAVLNSIIGPDQMATVPPEGIFSIEVNTSTNAVKLINNISLPLAINYYEITSAGGALNPSGWTSLDDQEMGDPPGQGWDESGGVSANQLIELALPEGGVTIGANAELNLGSAFNKAIFGDGNDGDLAFNFGLLGGTLFPGAVTYVSTPGGDDADFDSDGDVDGADFLTWQRGVGNTSADKDDGDANNDNNVTGTDLAVWRSQFGPASVAAAGSVPEPAAAGLGALALLAVVAGKRGAGTRKA
jgi:hypothetical protein